MEQRARIITVTLHTAVDRVLEVPHLTVGGHLAAKQIAQYPAGKGVNVSQALARLGCDSIATGFVGQQEAPWFEQFLAQAGPGRAGSQMLSVRGPTRENLTLLDPVNHTDTHLRTLGYQVTRHDVQRIVSKLGLLVRQGTLVAFCGSLPPGMDPADFDTLIYVTLGAGGRVVLDVPGRLLTQATSLDLGVTSQPGPASQASGEEKPLWLVKPNREELAEALGLPEDAGWEGLLDAGRRLAQRVQWVVITLGAQGALLFYEENAWRGWCQPDPQGLVSTVGCGDCLLAGLLQAQLAGLEPPDALRRGVAVAAANTRQIGVAQFTPQLVQALEQQTHVEPV